MGAEKIGFNPLGAESVSNFGIYLILISQKTHLNIQNPTTHLNIQNPTTKEAYKRT